MKTGVRTYPFLRYLRLHAHACRHWTVVLFAHKGWASLRNAFVANTHKYPDRVLGASPGGSLPTHGHWSKTRVAFLHSEKLVLDSSIFLFFPAFSKQPSCFKADFISLVKIVWK